jgi:hypothetical protein
MPRTRIAPNIATEAGALLTLVAADSVNHMEFLNNGNQVLRVKNGSAGSLNVTLRSAPDKFGRSLTKVVVVAATEDKAIGPFLPDLYNQSDNTVQVDFSASATITVGVLSLQS